ncbi:MAG: tetratricopeptide repeat protein, partial [Holophagae bacterium]|nr:tetratricopeptide repeat protein [Holophagae bacterium]
LDDAGYYFNTAIAFNSAYALGYFNLGELERSKGNFEKAIHFYQETLKRDPHHIPSITQMGFAYLNLKKMDESEEMFQIAVELDPEESSAYLGLSECSRAKRKYRQQLSYVKMAQKLVPENSQMLNYMGVAYQCNQNFSQAEQAYLASLKADPHNRKTANNLAYLYEKKYNRVKSKREKAGLKEKAIAAWEVRLLACRSGGTSIRGAQNHLRNFGITDKEIDNLLRLGDVTELSLIQKLQGMTFDLD